MAAKQRAYPLACKVRDYKWGKVGSDSTVAKFAAAGDASFKLDPATPYAELWMGDHPNAPSQISDVDENQQLLGDWLADNKWSLGEKAASTFKGKMPFLFKVLSINKALSIQAHPDKALAAICRAEDPAHYADDNHKPEMAIALTPFQGLCGFRPVAELADYLKVVPEFKKVVGSPADDLINAIAGAAPEDQLKNNLKACFAGLMRCDAAIVKSELEGLVERLSNTESKSTIDALLLRLNEQHPGGDVGCFCIYFLNVVDLDPGEALFLAANEPHAYLFGDCIECMATSDNVVRAGLTPKFKDVDRLVEMLTYKALKAADNKFSGSPDPEDNMARLYKTPVPEFDVAYIKYSPKAAQQLKAIAGPSIFITVKGGGSIELTNDRTADIKLGQTFFVPAGAMPCISAGSDGLDLYRAYCE